MTQVIKVPIIILENPKSCIDLTFTSYHGYGLRKTQANTKHMKRAIDMFDSESRLDDIDVTEQVSVDLTTSNMYHHFTFKNLQNQSNQSIQKARQNSFIKLVKKLSDSMTRIK